LSNKLFIVALIIYFMGVLVKLHSADFLPAEMGILLILIL